MASTVPRLCFITPTGAVDPWEQFRLSYYVCSMTQMLSKPSIVLENMIMFLLQVQVPGRHLVLWRPGRAPAGMYKV